MVLYQDGVRFGMWANMPVGMLLLRVLQQLIAINNSDLEEAPPSGARRKAKTGTQKKAAESGISDASEFNLYSWRQDEIPRESKIIEVPKPGIVMAVHRDTAKKIGSSSDFGVTLQLRRMLERDEGKLGQRLQRFLQDDDASFEPLPYAKYDVFMSYSTEDLSLAQDLVDDLQRCGLRCFLASRNISSGRLWQEEIRQALVASRVAVLLLTPNSVSSAWVMCEAGAGWALDKNIVPALIGVDVKQTPEIISGYQCRAIDSADGRAQLLEELKDLCAVSSGALDEAVSDGDADVKHAVATPVDPLTAAPPARSRRGRAKR